MKASVTAEWPVIRHTFSHYNLEISPVLVKTRDSGDAVMEADNRLWYNHEALQAKGFAAPVRKLLERWNSQDKGKGNDENGALHQAG